MKVCLGHRCIYKFGQSGYKYMMLLLKVIWSQWWQPTPVVDKNCISHAFSYLAFNAQLAAALHICVYSCLFACGT